MNWIIYYLMMKEISSNEKNKNKNKNKNENETNKKITKYEEI